MSYFYFQTQPCKLDKKSEVLLMKRLIAFIRHLVLSWPPNKVFSTSGLNCHSRIEQSRHASWWVCSPLRPQSDQANSMALLPVRGRACWVQLLISLLFHAPCWSERTCRGWIFHLPEATLLSRAHSTLWSPSSPLSFLSCRQVIAPPSGTNQRVSVIMAGIALICVGGMQKLQTWCETCKDEASSRGTV